MDPETEHPGIEEIYRLMRKHRIRANRLAYAIDVQTIRIYEILKNRRRITADTDLRLCRLFKLPDGHFLGLQAQYDLAVSKSLLSGKLGRIKTIDELATAS
jgi:addiction module HigA family antidote